MKQVCYEKEIPAFLIPYLDTREMQRLKKIDMNCGMNYTSVPLFKGIDSYSRYTHSAGVALIVYHFTHDPVQTLAGLFHDIATPAFSHVIDFLHGDALTQESTEDYTREILQDSKEIMVLLAKDQIALADVCDYHMYPIADNDKPMLSSDRLEYTFGAAIDYRFGTSSEYQKLYDDIIVGQNESAQPELIFQHQEQAAEFALLALRNGSVFTSQEDRCCMEMLARLVKEAIQKNILTEKDLYTDEENVIEILEHSALQKAWQEYREVRYVISSQERQEGWIQLNAKKRYIDPYCLETQGRISKTNAEVREKIDSFLSDTYQEWMKGMK